MNPYLLDFTSGSSDITVNKLKTNYLGNISVPLSSLPDVNIITESLGVFSLIHFEAINSSNVKLDAISPLPHSE